MKSEKGITLISVIIYVLVMAIVIGVMAIISTFFYKNISDEKFNIDPITEYTTFNSYFSEEINHENVKILECEPNYIVFDNGVQYTYIPENQGIYRNQVKIAKGVTNCTFTRNIKNGKDIVEVVFEAGSRKRETTYTLKN